MAIDRKELRIGSLVYYRPFGENEQKVCRIDTMSSESVNLTYGTFGVRGVEYEKLSPIEITPEILEHNGFVNTSYGYWHLLQDVSPEVRYDVTYTKNGWINAEQQNYSEGKISHKAMTTIKYLHELQNVFWMARIEKEVTI